MVEKSLSSSVACLAKCKNLKNTKGLFFLISVYRIENILDPELPCGFCSRQSPGFSPPYALFALGFLPSADIWCLDEGETMSLN